jgi:hypothetical protein
MSDQPKPRPDSEGSGAHDAGASPSGYEPPRFVPPQGSEIPAPPLYDPNQYGAGLYGQRENPSGQQYGAPYGQASTPYGQPNPYSQPGPYGQPQYYGQAEPKGLSIASMVCGIASVLLGWLFIPQIAAIITGHMALRREPSARGLSITGLVLGYLCLLGYGALWLLLIIGLMSYGSMYGPMYGS